MVIDRKREVTKTQRPARGAQVCLGLALAAGGSRMTLVPRRCVAHAAESLKSSVS